MTEESEIEITGKQRRKGIYILPNLFTTSSLFAGFYAIVQASMGGYENAAIAIFISMIMDGLDGRVARMTNTTSDFGAEFDSLADMVCFGLTPALVIYDWALSSFGKLGWLVAFLYVAATALRLARFNTQVNHDKHYFQGLACPAAAAVLAATVWVFNSPEARGQPLAIFSLLLTLVSAAAMVSNIRYRSFKDFDLKGRVPFVALLALVVIFVTISFDPPKVLFVGFMGYLFSGPAVALWRRRNRAVRAQARAQSHAADIDKAQNDT
ncbi:MAG TPA: CDP-diacylglycerol--serine O-phosphatidyltransferase [Gammaproteobacteria bacterium]|nr:CDP-diacylglycerol--serine O-phosphatidyltransferase [Gammaproteobacteria bacterium]